MARWSNNAVLIDVYHGTRDLDVAKTKGLIDGVIVKLGGSETSPNMLPYTGYPTKEGPPYNPYYDIDAHKWIQFAYDLDVPCMTYWNVNPRIYFEREITYEDLPQMDNSAHPVLQMILRMVVTSSGGFRKIHGLMFDLEDYSYWPGTLQINALWQSRYIEDLRERLVGLMKRGLFPNIPLGVYSRKSFIDAKEESYVFSTMFENRPEYLLWTANYPTLTVPADVYTMFKTLRPLDSHNPIPFGYSSKDPNRPWDFWQFQANKIDMNLFNGTKEQLNTLLNYVPRGTVVTPPPVVEPPTGTVDLTGINAKLDAILSSTKDIRSKFS